MIDATKGDRLDSGRSWEGKSTAVLQRLPSLSMRYALDLSVGLLESTCRSGGWHLIRRRTGPTNNGAF